MGALPVVVRLSSCEDLREYLKSTTLKPETVTYLFEQEVDGPSFIELTEESIRSNFPKLNFGQRKECVKIIKSILSSKDKFIFSYAEIKDEANEIYDAAKVKIMNPEELSDFLQQRSQHLLPETIQLLLNEEVDGESFLDLTDESLIENFPDLSLEERMSILNVIACAGDFLPNPSFQFENHNVIEIPLDEDLECSVLQGFVDKDGVLKPITSGNSERVDVAPCLSGSFLKKRKRKSSGASARKPKTSPDETPPLDVLTILNQSHEGEKVIEYIRTKNFCDITHQIIMMRLLYEHYCSDQESPVKYYPYSDTKISMAKGIVNAFPQLADVGECEYASWQEVVKTKFETVQSKLEPHKKKNAKPAKVGPRQQKTSRKKFPQTSSAVLSVASPQPENEETVNNQIAVMGQMLPSLQNKPMISLALSQTYIHRRKWILSDDRPSVTEIINIYKHLKSYEGEMLSEEFRRIHRLHDDAIDKFKRAVPFIIEYANTHKLKILEAVSNKFTNGNLKALVLLTKLLTVTINKNTSSPDELEHVKNFKDSIESIPSSALFQVVPDGTDVESFVSVETHPVSEEQETPVFPFLLWVTRDYKSGIFYLKIDKLCFLIGRVENEDSIVKAFDIFVKAHHVFMVKYHPFLKTTVFDYFEYLYGIKTPLPSVARFISALRNIAK